MSWLGLERRVAVVTGAGRGIGAAIALELARNGARVAALDIDAASAEATAQEALESSGSAIAVKVDVTSQESVGTAAEEVTARLGAGDVLVNNAAAVGKGRLSDLSLADWHRLLDVNLTGHLLCSQHFGAGMRQRGRGTLIHVSSIAGINPQTDSGAYSPSKAAVAMLSRLLAVEWGPDGVRSNALAPGMTRTPMGDRLYQVPGVLEARSNAVPLRRIATPQDIANACAWLASDRASYVTGQEIVVDGGFTQGLMGHVPRPRL